MPVKAVSLRVLSEKFAHLLLGEGIVSGRHRGMGGEQRRRTHEFKSLAERIMAVLHILAEPLQTCECGVTLVVMVHRRIQAKCAERPDAAYAQQNLLLEPVLVVTAVKLVRDGAVLLSIGLIIGVQKIEIRTAHSHFPNTGVKGPSRKAHTYALPYAVLPYDRLHRNLEKVLGDVLGHLVALRGKFLAEISVAVQKADGREVHVHIRSLLQIVSRQNSQTAGIYLEGCVQTVFHTEICDGRLLPFRLLGHIGIEILYNAVHTRYEVLVPGQFIISFKTYLVQNFHRIMAGLMPQVSVNALEQGLGLIIPAPPEVFTQSFQPGKLFREVSGHHHIFP